MDRQYIILEEYAKKKGFVLQRFLLNCIEKGNWSAIASEYEDGSIMKEFRDSLGKDVRSTFMFLALFLGQMEHSAILGGLSTEDASFICVKAYRLAQDAETAEQIIDIHMQCMRELCYAVAEQKELRGKYAAVIQCQRFIQDHIYDDFSAKVPAEKLGYNPDYLARLFKEKTGMTISEYTQRQKIEESKYLLLHSTQSIAAISANLGFCNQSYFTSVFKKYEHMTPRQFQNEKKRPV